MYNPLVKAAADEGEPTQVQTVEPDGFDTLKRALTLAGSGTVGGLSGLALGGLAGRALGLDDYPAIALAIGSGVLGSGLGAYTGDRISVGQGWVRPDAAVSLPNAMLASGGMTGGILLSKWLRRKLR